MRIKEKIHKILSIILVLSLVFPAIPAVKAEAADILEGPDVVSGSAIKGITVKTAGGAVVNGAEGKEYTLNHEYVKELNINTGSITIDDTSYSQVNGNSEAWDASSNAYVIKGEGTSANNIVINSVNTPITVYLVDLNWSGYIEVKGNINIFIVGSVYTSATGDLIRAGASQNIDNLNISGISGKDTLECNSLLSINNNTTNLVHIKDLTVRIDSLSTRTIFFRIIIENSQIAILSESPLRLMKRDNVEEIIVDIINSTINNFKFDFDVSSGTFIGTINIENSEVNNLFLRYGAQGSGNKMYYLNINNSFGRNITFSGLGSVSANNLNVSLKDSHFLNVKCLRANSSYTVTMWKFKAVNSTFVLPISDDVDAKGVGFQSNSNSISYSSVGNIHSNYNLGSAPVDNNGISVYLRKIKFKDFTNTYVLATFEDGVISKLVTDSDGYLYIYVPYGSKKLSFQITDETGIEDYGKYVIEYPAVTGDDKDNTYEPVATKKPTDIATPYFNAEIQYSFDKNNWNNATTDSAGYFKAIIPDDASRIYIKLDKIKYAIISNGVVGPFYDEEPIITDQSNPELAFLKEKQGTIYVIAIPYTTGNTLTYQWYKDGEILTGRTSSVLNLLAVQDSDAGTYTCVITEKDGNSIISNPITVTVESGQLEEEKELVILSQSTRKTLIKGYSAELYVNARASLSTRELFFKWYKDGAELHNEVQSRLLLNSVNLDDSGSYICRVYEGTNYIDSVPIIVTVENNPLEDEVTNLNNLVNDLTGQVETLTEQLNNANQEKKALQSTIDGLENQITAYQNQIAELQGNVTDLEQELQNANENNEALNLTIQELNNQIKTLNQQIVSLKTDLEAVNAEKSILESTIIDLNYEITNLKSQVTLLENKLVASEEENAQLLDQVAELQDTLSRLNNNIINLQNEIASLTNQNNALIGQVESLNDQKTALENEIQRLQSLLDDANSTIDSLTEQVNNLTNQVDSLTEQLEAANNEKKILQNTITGLEDEITNLNNQISGLNNKVSELEEALQKEGADKDKLNKTIQGLNDQISSLNQNVSSLQTELDTITNERNSLQDTVTKLNNDITNLNNQISILEGKLAASEEENAQLLKQIKELQDTISGLESNITDLQRDVETLNDSNRELQGQLNIAKGTITTLNNLLFLIKSELGVVDDDEIIPAIKQLKAQLLQEKANNILLQQQMNELDKELIAVKENNSSLKDKLKELMELVGSKDEDGIKDKIIDLQTTLSESERIITELQKEKNELINKLQEAENLNKELQKKIDELLELSGEDTEELKKQILDLTNQINKLIENNNSLHNSIRDLDSKISELNSEKATLESEIVRLETLLDTANSTIDELREQLADMAADKTSLENENSELKKEIERLKQLLENSNNSGGSSISGNGSGYVDNSKKEKELQDKLDQTLKELEDVKKELEELKKSINETGSEKEPGTNSEKDDIKIPKDSVVVLPAEKVEEPVIKESVKKPVTKDKITAQEGWELAPTLDSKWVKEINLIEAVGTSNVKNEIVDLKFYARKEDKPEQVYNYSVEVKKPSAIPNFTMDKIIYLGNDFKLNLTNVTEDTKVTYKSLNNSIATVNKNGVITPKKSGKTTITGTAYKDGVPYQFTVNVIVKDQDRVTSNLKEQTIQTASSEPVLVVYKLVYKDSATKLDINGYADDAVVSYTSSDSTIATVNQDGVIKGINKGRATITATIVQNNKIYNYILIVRVDDGTPDATVSDYLLVA